MNDSKAATSATSASNSDQDRANALVEELVAMRVELMEKLKQAAHRSWMKEATADIYQEIMDELQPQGRWQETRRLSDPENAAGRNAAFTNRISEVFDLKSAGAIALDHVRINKFRMKKRLK